MTSNGMDTTALPRHQRSSGRFNPVGVLIVTLLLFCSAIPPLHAREATTDSPGVAELLRGTPSSAIPLLEREAAAGDGRAAAHLAVTRHYGWGAQVNEASALQLARQAEAAGYVPATLLRHLEFESAPNEQNLKTAKSATESLARRGDSLAQFYFAMAVTKDVGAGTVLRAMLLADQNQMAAYPDTLQQIKADPNYLSGTTRKYLGKAHTAGFAPATYLLGAFAAKGVGRAPNAAEAIEFWRTASARDFAPAATAIGQFIDRGLVTDPALKAAGPAPWYEQAAARGDPEALHQLAILHVGGYGVPKDYARAETLLRQAVEQGRTESEGDLRFVQSVLSDQQDEERRRQHDLEAAERDREVRERAARTRQERELALASAATTAATDTTQDATSGVPLAFARPTAADQPASSLATSEPPAADTAGADMVAPSALSDDPSLTQLDDDNPLEWLLGLAALLVIAELVRRVIRFAAFWVTAGFASGYASDLPSGLKIFAVGFLGLRALAFAPVYYALVALLLWSAHQSHLADLQVRQDVAKTGGALQLAAGESVDTSGIVLVTDPEWLGAGGVAIRVRNESGHGDLALVTSQCTFYLRNGEDAHTDELVFEFDQSLPSGFGMRAEARSRATLQYQESDYQRDVSCQITSALLRTPPTRADVRLAGIRYENLGFDGELRESCCLQVEIENLTQANLEDLEITCITGFDRDHAEWTEVSRFRREFARKDEPLVPAGSTVLLRAPARAALEPEGSSPRCDVTDVEWQ